RELWPCVAVRLPPRLRFGRTAVPQEYRQADDRGDCDELALPVLHRLEPELRRRQVAPRRDRGLAVLQLLFVERLRTADGVQCDRREEQREKRDRQRVLVDGQ